MFTYKKSKKRDYEKFVTKGDKDEECGEHTEEEGDQDDPSVVPEGLERERDKDVIQ